MIVIREMSGELSRRREEEAGGGRPHLLKCEGAGGQGGVEGGGCLLTRQC